MAPAWAGTWVSWLTRHILTSEGGAASDGGTQHCRRTHAAAAAAAAARRAGRRAGRRTCGRAAALTRQVEPLLVDVRALDNFLQEGTQNIHLLPVAAVAGGPRERRGWTTRSRPRALPCSRVCCHSPHSIAQRTQRDRRRCECAKTSCPREARRCCAAPFRMMSALRRSLSERLCSRRQAQ